MMNIEYEINRLCSLLRVRIHYFNYYGFIISTPPVVELKNTGTGRGRS